MSPTQNKLYEQASLPVLQNRVFDTRFEALDCVTGNISLVQDLRTGLIYNEAFRPELLTYDSAYNNEQGLSQNFQEHLREAMGIVARVIGKERLVEVGCGKGTFLEMLEDSGFDVSGFDPSYEGSNPRVEKHLFRKDAGIKADGLVLRHVLEHICDPVSFLQDLSECNGGRGRIYIEVPCLDWICEHKTWFDVFYEHVNYFRLTDFYRMFSEIVEAGKIFGGQYLYVVAELSSIRQPRLASQENHFVFPSDFTAGIHAKKYTTDGPTVVWGGASKGVVFSLLRTRAGYTVDAVVDINPGKQGKFLPLTGLRVDSPQDVVSTLKPGSLIFVMNSNYLEEIKTMTQNKFTYMPTDNE